MIKLELLEACENCSDLTPKKTLGYNVMYGGTVLERNCTITCENIEKCRALLEYLEKEVKKNG